MQVESNINHNPIIDSEPDRREHLEERTAMIAFSNRVKGVYVAAFLSLFLGGLIYVLWRPDTIRFFGWLNSLGMRVSVDFLRTQALPFYSYLPDWVVFSLPNGLWAFSYALIMTHLWWGRNSCTACFWLGSIPLVCLGYEFMQYVGIIQGCFCLKDVLFSIGGLTIGGLMGAWRTKSIRRVHK